MAVHRAPLPEVPEELFPKFHRHVCPPTFNGGPVDGQEPTRRIERQLAENVDAELPDGEKLTMWNIRDRELEDGRDAFPSPLVRTVEGDIVHARVHNNINTHTIHWHGIEPTPVNDGVGKHSFEVSGNFIYQFATHQAGTYFFHCHKNTTLHFERGLYGLLLVDPKKPDTAEAAGVPEPPYPAGGPGFVAAWNPPTHVRKYDVEALWVFDDIDTTWLDLQHNAFMQKCDPDDPIGKENPDNFTQDGILHDFRPDVFHISGVLRRKNDPTPFNEVAANAKVSQTVLLRILNASYTVQEFRIGTPAEVVGMDGYPLGVAPSGKYSRPVSLAANQPFRLTTAMRWDILVRAEQPGQFPVECRMLQWISGEELFKARTFINVSA